MISPLNSYEWVLVIAVCVSGAGGNEYGQCAFRVDKSLRVKNNARDIRLPITCVSHLRVRQVWPSL